MKVYQKAEMMAKNLPTGSYAAGCPTGERRGSYFYKDGRYNSINCYSCEVAQ